MEKKPQHVAIIMDGNRRWAKKRGLLTEKGHQAGAEALERILQEAKKQGVRYLTVFALSTENLTSRSNLELRFLFALMGRVLKEKIKTFEEKGIGLKVIGDTSVLPDSLQQDLKTASGRLEGNSEITLVVAVNYGGRAEIVNAVRSLGEENVSEKSIGNHLYTSSLPDPDLIIRTGGQKRLSNFLLWQSNYSELFFSDILWPDFSENEFIEILEEFKERKRNFGK